jgi:hypothetical protein
MIIYDQNGQPYEADLVPGEKNRELERELADCRRTCAELVTDGNAVTLAQSVQRLSAENANLREDKARLDSGIIRLVHRDEFGESSPCVHTALDLRAAIDQARQSDRPAPPPSAH